MKMMKQISDLQQSLTLIRYIDFEWQQGNQTTKHLNTHLRWNVIYRSSVYLFDECNAIIKQTYLTHKHTQCVQCIWMLSNAWVDRMIVLLLHVIAIIYVKLNTKSFILNNKHWPSEWNQSFWKAIGIGCRFEAIFWFSKPDFRIALLFDWHLPWSLCVKYSTRSSLKQTKRLVSWFLWFSF